MGGTLMRLRRHSRIARWRLMPFHEVPPLAVSTTRRYAVFSSADGHKLAETVIGHHLEHGMADNRLYDQERGQ